MKFIKKTLEHQKNFFIFLGVIIITQVFFSYLFYCLAFYSHYFPTIIDVKVFLLFFI